MRKRINVLVDWGKAFVNLNGSFYCGTTEAQKDRAAEVLSTSDLVLYLSDVHSRTSSEFTVNGGLYPAHNLVQKHWKNLEDLAVEPGKDVSPQLTEKLYDLVKDKRSGLIVPRHVFLQDYNGEKNPQPAFTINEVSETFGVTPLYDPRRFLDGEIDYVVNAKHLFDGTRTNALSWLGSIPGVPDLDMNVFSLLKQKYGQGEDLEFDFTGVVTGICLYQSASGTKQLFPRSTVNIISDAATHLVYAPLGIESEDMGNIVARKMCQQVGVNYISTAEYLGGK
ncbi:hypothetical protein COY27_06650 [Candidatus Woesearchaeota archaeon CG_4_10_14_0_2_um_filter_33_13]|nr:MAG: hypothetical protein COY27_06650 [Candidatus Woesearchaeota archaeon CG_4_10_14_0_2_um_filter_33_13]